MELSILALVLAILALAMMIGVLAGSISKSAFTEVLFLLLFVVSAAGALLCALGIRVF